MDVKFESKLSNWQSLCAILAATTWQITTSLKVFVVVVATMELNGNHIKLLHHEE